ncbi:hypothetical protein MVEN_00804600 [Mycena venus]|uniref:Alfy-like armadillo-like repeat domain-containing protein n=1 Tax=Mycena venus TaxID=2733690 RepID=A0A8H6YLC5_9AGAR|nr:hypothetical protein MVEN_00804600 [Mycena venus]
MMHQCNTIDMTAVPPRAKFISQSIHSAIPQHSIVHVTSLTDLLMPKITFDKDSQTQSPIVEGVIPDSTGSTSKGATGTTVVSSTAAAASASSTILAAAPPPATTSDPQALQSSMTIDPSVLQTTDDENPKNFDAITSHQTFSRSHDQRDVTDSVGPGVYHMCTIVSSATHQPAIVPVAQHGSQHGSLDDCIYVLVEIQRIMMQDVPGVTKDVFREMDGFVGLMSALSTTPERNETEESISETIECSRLPFMITSDAITNHAENKRVGYESMATMIQSLVADPHTVDYTLGLLSFAFSNFSLSGPFKSLHTAPDADATIREVCSRLGSIKRPGTITLLVRLAPSLLIGNEESDRKMRYALKLYESPATTTHHNHIVLTSSVDTLPLAPLQTRSTPDPERNVLQKLLRRLLDMGATPTVARYLFQTVVKEGEKAPGTSGNWSRTAPCTLG